MHGTRQVGRLLTEDVAEPIMMAHIIAMVQAYAKIGTPEVRMPLA